MIRPIRLSVLVIFTLGIVFLLSISGCGSGREKSKTAPAKADSLVGTKDSATSAPVEKTGVDNRKDALSVEQKNATVDSFVVSKEKNITGSSKEKTEASPPKKSVSTEIKSTSHAAPSRSESAKKDPVTESDKKLDSEVPKIELKQKETVSQTVKTGSAFVLNDAQKSEAQKVLDALKDFQIGIDKFLIMNDFSFDGLSASFEKLRSICQETGLKLKLDFSPFFERPASYFTIVEKSPFNWAFVITPKKYPKDKRECLLFNAAGKTPKMTLTEGGKWKIGETGLFLLSYLDWSLVDAEGKTVAAASHPFIKKQNYNSSVYFPAGDTPHFLVLIFYRELVQDGGTNLLNDGEFYMHPQGLKRVVLPVYGYYDAEKKKLEKQRGSKFETSSVSSKPSPNSTPIGNVIYGRFVDKFFEGFHLNDKNDVGFDIYLEDAGKRQLLLYHGTP